MGYRVFYHFDNGTVEDILGEVFNSKIEAELAASEGAADYDTGRELLQSAGEEFSEENITRWSIIKTK